MRFTGLRIKQASRNSTTGQCLLIKPECVKERQANGERKPEKVMVSCSLFLISSHCFFPSHTRIYIERENERERKRGGEHKESARKVYNALKPARHSLLYIKSVNSLVNVPMVPHRTAKLSQHWGTEIPEFTGGQTGSASASLDYCHPLCVTHTHTHTLT